ncbi:MAG: hypothetical protein P8Z49_09870 [Acidobacteriota bacterium]
MKKRILMITAPLALGVMVTAGVLAGGGGVFAPWAHMTQKGAAMMKMAGQDASNSALPTAEEVGVPCYPGAVVISYPHMEINGKPSPMEALNLGAPDTPDKVLAFYKAELAKIPGWEWDAQFKFFHKGGSAMDAIAEKVPGLTIQELNPESFDLKMVDPAVARTLKTRIQVMFKAPRPK